MRPAVATFTDTYLPTVNGVTYTIAAWRERYLQRGGRMDVVYPESTYDPDFGEHPVRSVPFPFYDGYRLGVPSVPASVTDVDLVHAHTPFTLGVAGFRLARREDLPLIISYHTPTTEYATYLAPESLAGVIGEISDRYERWFLNQADLVLAPSDVTAESLTDVLDDGTILTHSNGVDITQFRPVDESAFRSRYDVPDDRPVIGYTGRHGFEKNLGALLEAAVGLDVFVLLAGDGPARDRLEQQAAELDLDVSFLGFLERGELPEFYSTLDVFAFPSPVETEGIVALEANACGTPVVGVNQGALAETIHHGTTGYHFEHGDIDGFRSALRRAIDENERLSEACRDHREEISLERSLDRLETTYESLLD